MSTKIYNGYRLPMMSLSELRDFCLDAQQRLQALRKKQLASRIAQDIAYLHDDVASGQLSGFPDDIANKGYSFPSFFNIKFRNKLRGIEKSNVRDPQYDLSANACFFPMSDKVLALWYADNREFSELWESLPGVADYHYQNQTDRPDGISEAEWTRRRKGWDFVLGGDGYGIPSQNGFSFVFCDFNIYEFPSHEELLAAMPTFEDRLKRLSFNAAVEARWKDVATEEGAAQDKSGYFDVMESIRWVRDTEEGIAAAEQQSLSIRPKLKAVFTSEDLLTKTTPKQV